MIKGAAVAKKLKRWLRYTAFIIFLLVIPGVLGALTQVFFHMGWIGVVIGVGIMIYIGMETSILDKDG
jgi:hypothetical protein